MAFVVCGGVGFRIQHPGCLVLASRRSRSLSLRPTLLKALFSYFELSEHSETFLVSSDSLNDGHEVDSWGLLCPDAQHDRHLPAGRQRWHEESRATPRIDPLTLILPSGLQSCKR